MRVGEVRKIAHVLSRETDFAVTTPLISIYDSAGTVTAVSGAAGTVDNGNNADEHEISYLWTPSAAGDFRYQLTGVVGTETVACWGSIYVLPIVSKYDRWIQAVMGYVQEPGGGEEQQLLATRDYIRAIDAARQRYQRDWPRRRLNNAAGEVLTTAWEYALPSDWVDGFSQILRFEYPVDSTVQSRPYLEPALYFVDALRSKWAFRDTAPSAGQYARFTYTTEHSLSHTEDTLPAHHFHALALYAAGEAMEYAANEATRTDARSVAAEVANFRTKQQERRSQAGLMKRQAVEAWAEPRWGL